MPYSYPSRGPIHSRIRSYFRPRFRFGLGWGLAGATAFSGFAMVVALIQHRAFFPQYGVGLGTIITAYYVGGALCGIVLAVAYPLFRHRWGAVFLGFVLATLIYGAMGVALFGARPLTLGMAVLLGLITGAGGGLVLFDEAHPVAPKPRHHDAAG
jgi:hypothetical protein